MFATVGLTRRRRLGAMMMLTLSLPPRRRTRSSRVNPPRSS